MFRLVRLNEVQYAETEAQKNALVEKGFIVDETAFNGDKPEKADGDEDKPEKTDGDDKPKKRNKGGA